MKFKNLFLTATVSASALLLSSGLSAQTSDNPEDEIIVTGIRGALQKAINIKRNSSAVVDAISAEDIGKFPDSNVAESLARIPGVTVGRQFGEGSEVSIRGASNEHTLTTLNGQNVASTGWYTEQAVNRSFNYSLLPPEMISGIEVYKSSQADLVEGGLGGTVNVKTRKPLDLDANTVFVNIKGANSTASDVTDLSYSGLYSYKNKNKTFGVLASIAKSDYTLIRRGDESLPSWGGRFAPVNFLQERNRTAYDIVAQYKPIESLDLSLHYMSLTLSANNNNRGVFIPSDGNSCTKNPQDAPIYCSSSSKWEAEAGLGGQGFWDNRVRLSEMKSDLLDLSVAYEGNNFRVTSQAGATKATGGTSFETQLAYVSNIGGAVGTIDATGDRLEYDLKPRFMLPSAGNYTSWEGLQPGAGATGSRLNSDGEQYLQADVEFDTQWGFFNSVDFVDSIKAGVRYTNHDVKKDQLRPSAAVVAAFNASNQHLTVNPNMFLTGKNVTIGKNRFSMQELDVSKVLAYAYKQFGTPDTWLHERAGYGTINEKNISAYVMATFKTDRFRGNLGVRYISTNASADYYNGDITVTGEALAANNGVSKTLSTDKASYDDFLPSLNIAYDIEDNIILRFAASQVISRTIYNDLFVSPSLIGYADNIPGNETVAKGNIGLLPAKSTQFDLTVEYYFGRNSLFSAGVFTKTIDGFPTFSNKSNQSIGLVDSDTQKDSWLVQTKYNGKGGTVNGLELQFQHALDNGLGLSANYTLADAKVKDSKIYVDGNLRMSNGSKHTVNSVLYYENESFSLRGAYSWRSAYFIRETGFYGAREHQAYGQIDLSGTYHFNDIFDFSLQVNNLLEADSIQVGRDRGKATTFRTSYGYPSYSYVGERRIILGVSVRF